MKGAGLAAGSLVLPQFLPNPLADAAELTGGGLRMLRFAHLTDLHFTTRPTNRYPTSHVHIKRAAADLNKQDLDFVLFTGDMFHYPEDVEADMPALQDALQDLKHPYYIALGNHDTEGHHLQRRKRFLCNAFKDHGLIQGDPYYHFSPLPGLRFVVLDSTDVPGDSYLAWTGHFSERQARWLRETLTKYRDETVFIAMHHPPITPYPFMDKLKFETPDVHRLSDVLNNFPNVQLMFAGHYHFGGLNTFGPADLMLGPSLVEHPHCYRVVEVQHMSHGHGAIAYHWQNLHLHGDEDDACAHGMPAVRSFALMSLSYMRSGFMPITLAT